MKIRFGFVSNSSSTSFCIYGADIKKELEEIRGDKDWDEILNELVKDTGLKYEFGQDEECIYIGRLWSSIKDGETGKQFKESVAKGLEKIFKKEIKCNTHEEGLCRW